MYSYLDSTPVLSGKLLLMYPKLAPPAPASIPPAGRYRCTIQVGVRRRDVLRHFTHYSDQPDTPFLPLCLPQRSPLPSVAWSLGPGRALRPEGPFHLPPRSRHARAPGTHPTAAAVPRLAHVLCHFVAFVEAHGHGVAESHGCGQGWGEGVEVRPYSATAAQYPGSRVPRSRSLHPAISPSSTRAPKLRMAADPNRSNTN